MDHHDRDDGVSTARRHQLGIDQPRHPQQGHHDRQLEAQAEGQQQRRHQVQIVRHLGQQVGRHPVADDLLAQREPHHERQHDEIDQGRSQQEQHRRRHQERQEGAALVAVKPRRDEAIKLPGQHRKRDEDRAEPGQLHLGEQDFQRRRIDQVDRMAIDVRQRLQPRRAQDQIQRGHMAVRPDGGIEGLRRHERLHKEQIDRLGKGETADETDREGDDADQQPPAQLDQMIHQRRARRLDLGFVTIGQGQRSAAFLRATLGVAAPAGVVLGVLGVFEGTALV
jgi:hypothetical protein